jgi:hypothetical protein
LYHQSGHPGTRFAVVHNGLRHFSGAGTHPKQAHGRPAGTTRELAAVAAKQGDHTSTVSLPTEGIARLKAQPRVAVAGFGGLIRRVMLIVLVGGSPGSRVVGGSDLVVSV